MKPFFKSRFLITLIVVSIFLSAVFVPAALASESAVVNATVILRKSSSVESKALQTLPQGEEVSVLGKEDNWYHINYGAFTGYIMSKYIDLSSNSIIAHQDAIKELGNPPGPLYIGDEGYDVEVLQEALKILGFYTMGIDGIYGNGTTTAVALYQQNQNLEPDGIAGRRTVSSIFGHCADTADITVSGRDSTKEDESNLKESDAGASPKNIVYSFSDISSVPGPSKEGDSGSDVLKLQQALYLLGYYSASIDGDYGTATVDAVTRFQINRKMNADGIAGTSTIRVLFSGTNTNSSSSSKSSYKTLVMDWFEDNVNKLIPKNAKFTIKDVLTGKKFSVVRWSGIYHLDAEPASSKDTASFKSICNGKWSWTRRPILILYNGKVYAASMNCMPHGTSTIDNNFDGHFCIHFRNSKTHETKVVDSDHQSAVDAAANAVW